MKTSSNILFKKMVSIYFILLYMIVVFIIFTNIDTNIKIMGLLGLGSFIISLITWKYVANEMVSAYVFYLCVAYIFLFGQSLLLPFNLINQDRNILNLRFVNEVSLYKAQIYTILCLICFHLGTLIFYKKGNIFFKKDKYKSRNILNKSITIAGIILLLISVAPYFYGMYNSIKIVRMYGYKGMYSQVQKSVGISSILKKLSQFFIPSLICLLIGYKNNDKMRKMVYSLSLVVITMILYIGERNDAIVFLIVIILIQHYFIKRITFKTSYKYIIIGVLLLVMLSSIASVRGLENRGFIDYLEHISNKGFNISLLTDTISELGWTMTPTAVVINLVESGEPLRYGSTYLYSLLSIVPNLGFWDIHPVAKISSLGSWLQSTLGISYGPGFSLVAESYLNFAWWGCLVFILLGGFIVRILGLLNKNTAQYNPEIACCVLLFLNAALFTIRDTFLGNIRAIFYVALPIYILIITVDKNIKRYGKMNIRTLDTYEKHDL